MIAATATHIGFFVAAGGWIAMFIATLFLPRRGSSPEQRSVIRELATGFRFIRGHRVLLVLMGFDWIGLLPEYVDQLGGGAREVGFVFSSVGIGGLWTGALAAAIGLRAGMMVGPVVLLVLIFTVFATQRKVRELHEDPALDG